MPNYEFIKNVEEMIDPIDVGTVSFMQAYAKVIPVSMQNQMIKKGASKSPYMGFVVEPYSLFLCYEIIDVALAQSMIPSNFKLIKTSIFEYDTPKYYCIFGAFNVHTSAFWGTRMEVYFIAEDLNTNLLSWVIVEYDTNTISYDERKGLSAGNTNTCIFTTNYLGDIILDIKNDQKQRVLEVEGNITGGVRKDINQRLWLEGNLSIAYGNSLTSNHNGSFAVMFEPGEVASALDIELEAIKIKANTWFNNLIAPTPSQIACFPFAQHFLSDSPGHYSTILNEEQLVKQLNQLDFTKIPRYSSKPIRDSFRKGQLISISLIIILIILLIIKW
ncbi:MAG: hypothetical protein ACRCTA_00765 [Bacilli bacterium]